jgi:hypothetical protein
MRIECADAMVIMDGENGGFMSYMKCEEVERINAIGGIANAAEVLFYETTDRPIPARLKDGEAVVMDVLVKLDPAVSINLN